MRSSPRRAQRAPGQSRTEDSGPCVVTSSNLEMPRPFGLARDLALVNALLGRAEPAREEEERGDEIRERCGDPHNESRELLVLERRQSPASRGGGVRWIPQSPREGQECAQRARVQCRAEKKKYGGAEAQRAGVSARCVCVHDRPPEQQGGAEEAEVLERVNAVAVERRLIQRRCVP